MKKPDPVVALLTAGGKKMWIPTAVLGAMEEMMRDPGKIYGANRLDIFRRAMVFLRDDVDEREFRRKEEADRQAVIEARRAEPGFVANRQPHVIAAEMDPPTLAELDAALGRALELAEPEVSKGGCLVSFLQDRLATVRDARQSTSGREAA